MTTELYEAGLFTLVEREKLHYVGEEIRLSQSGLMDESTAPELGKIKGVQYSMTGAVTEYHYKAAGGAVPIPGIGGVGGASNTAYVPRTGRAAAGVRRAGGAGPHGRLPRARRRPARVRAAAAQRLRAGG